jgi:hypothetical protein
MVITAVQCVSQSCTERAFPEYTPQETTAIYANEYIKFVETFTEINRVLEKGMVEVIF